MVVTPQGNIELTNVSELIDPDTRSWDEGKLRNHFFSVDVNRIMRIPLAMGMMGDFVSWNYTKTGIFTVRSAYYTEWNFQHGRKLRRTHGQGASMINPVWSKVWSLKISAKVNFFSSRFLHGTIPAHLQTGILYLAAYARCARFTVRHSASFLSMSKSS
jgi:hypothetical protein